MPAYARAGAYAGGGTVTILGEIGFRIFDVETG
jgi:hypothetical protein